MGVVKGGALERGSGSDWEWEGGWKLSPNFDIFSTTSALFFLPSPFTAPLHKNKSYCFSYTNLFFPPNTNVSPSNHLFPPPLPLVSSPPHPTSLMLPFFILFFILLRFFPLHFIVRIRESEGGRGRGRGRGRERGCPFCTSPHPPTPPPHPSEPSTLFLQFLSQITSPTNLPPPNLPPLSPPPQYGTECI